MCKSITRLLEAFGNNRPFIPSDSLTVNNLLS